jgi:hypothetical protein
VTAAAADRGSVVRAVRRTVRALLEQSPGFAMAAPALRRDVANKLVGVAMMSADLLADEARMTPPAPVAVAAAAPPADFGESARRAGKTFQDLRRSIDFPSYVTSLISGVFQAITGSNLSQISALSDLLDNVAASQEEFSTANLRDRDVVVWAIGKFPFLTSSDGESLALAGDADLSEKKALMKGALGATDREIDGIDPGDLMATLGPLVRRKLGRDRQAVLGTLVQMGLQRVVVDEGSLHASMDMRVDTRSVTERDQAQRTEAWLDTGASANVGIGAWGASAHVNAGFSRVESDHQYGKEELDTRAGLRSSVDLAFRTEQVPLDRLADSQARVKINANARVPLAVADAGTSLLTTQQHATTPGPNPTIQNPDRDTANADKAGAQARAAQPKPAPPKVGPPAPAST